MTQEQTDLRRVTTADGFTAYFRNVKYGEVDDHSDDETDLRRWVMNDVVQRITGPDGEDVDPRDMEVYEVRDLLTLILKGFQAKNSRRR